ncbi:MAG: TIR domain-containing protein [Verrucomicrobia bacterium]|nr:TIR domain-containing protein [Verrucomicrobiota bacterium]
MTILLDFDGTLVDQHRKQAFEKLVRCAVCPPHCRDSRWKRKLAARLLRDDKRLCAHTIYDRRTLFRLHAKYFPHLSPGTLCERFWNEVQRTQKVRRGFITLLKEWRKQRHTLVWATDTDGPGGNKLRRVMDPELRLSGFFGKNVFIGSEGGVPPKGDPRFVDHMLRELGINAEHERRNCVMIGDKVGSDLLPSAAAGISSILIRNQDYRGKWPAEVKKMAELKKAIQSLQVSVFVSYCHRDKHLVAKMENELKGTRVHFWRDARDVHEGDRFVPKIADAIRTQKAVLVVLTENSVTAPWVKFEVGQAVYYEVTQNKRVFTVLAGKVRNADIPGPLVGLVSADLRGRKFKAGMRQLRNAMNSLGRD